MSLSPSILITMSKCPNIYYCQGINRVHILIYIICKLLTCICPYLVAILVSVHYLYVCSFCFLNCYRPVHWLLFRPPVNVPSLTKLYVHYILDHIHMSMYTFIRAFFQKYGQLISLQKAKIFKFFFSLPKICPILSSFFTPIFIC